MIPTNDDNLRSASAIAPLLADLLRKLDQGKPIDLNQVVANRPDIEPVPRSFFQGPPELDASIKTEYRQGWTL